MSDFPGENRKQMGEFFLKKLIVQFLQINFGKIYGGPTKNFKFHYFCLILCLLSFGFPKLNNGLAPTYTLLNKGPGKER